MFRLPEDRTLYILLLRHSYAENDSGEGDEARALAREGVTAVKRCADFLCSVGDYSGGSDAWRVIASSAKRTMQTANLLHEAAPTVFPLPVRDDSLYNAPSSSIVSVLNDALAAGASRQAIVAHNPGVSDACRDMLMGCPESDIVTYGRCLPLQPCAGILFCAEGGVLRVVTPVYPGA